MSTSEILPVNHPTLDEQLIEFASTAHDNPGKRTWLKDDSGLMAYVRSSRKPYGPPLEGFKTIIQGEEVKIPTDVDCLEIASLDHSYNMEPIDMTEFSNFIETVFRQKLWDVVCLDNIGDPVVTDWCKEHGWTQDDRHSPDFYYITMPTDQDTILGVNRFPFEPDS